QKPAALVTRWWPFVIRSYSNRLAENGKAPLDPYDGGSLLFSCGQGAKLNETVGNRCLFRLFDGGLNGSEN
ncbi:hypothetical protein, partial [Microvirga pakistanensis]|uniref:hypothetical protein n=1 Tax=Microvirga pakistanensis TaxID=1682650 RepID=UPI001956288F